VRTRHVGCSVFASIAAIVIGGLVGSDAPGQTAPAPVPAVLPPAPAAGVADVVPPAAAPSETDAQHWAKDEVRCGDAWVLIDTVFKDYVAARAELQGLEDKAKAACDVVAAIQFQLNSMKNDGSQGDRPIRNEMAKAKAKQRELNHLIDAPQPLKPQLQPVPLQPKNYSANIHSSDRYSSTQSSYDQQMQDWQRRADAVNRANDNLTKKYQQNLATWKKSQSDAKTELPKVEQTIKDQQQKLEQSDAALATKQAPTLEKLKAANEDASAAGRRVSAAKAKLQVLADALKSAPETMRFKHGIVEWDAIFQPLADLEKTYVETQAEIDRVRDQMKEEAKDAGRPFPENWRHPQQDRMDAMKALITRAKAAV
jgi:DNA repair exonuclease SbcCD ATPase subunit